MRRTSWGPVVVVVLALAPALAQGGVRHALPGPAAGLAADDGRAAVLVGAPADGSGRVRVVWNLRTGRFVDVPVRGPVSFPAWDDDRLPTAAGHVATVALAGRRVLWRERFPGNSTEERLRQASTLDPVARRVGPIVRHENDRGTGTYLAGLVGDDTTLAYAATRLGLSAPDRCTGGPDDPAGACDLVTRAGLLRRLVPGGYRAIARGPSTPHAQAADAGRIVALRSDGDVVLLTTAGTLPPLEIDPGPEPAVAVALQGREPVVLTASGRLLHYGANGVLRRSLDVRAIGPFTPTDRLRLDAHGGVAVVTIGRVTYGVRLRDGRIRILVLFPVTAPVGVAIEAGGLTYAWNDGPRRQVGHLGFMPLAEVRARLG